MSRKDLFELLYESSRKIRFILKLYLKTKQKVNKTVRPRIKEKFEVGRDPKVKIQDGGTQPSAEFEIKLNNNNFTPLRINGIDVSLAFGRDGSFFDKFYWSRGDFSNPPKNIRITDIDGHGGGTIRIQTMLPIYLYFPNENHFSGKDSNVIHLYGTVKLDSDVGQIEEEFHIKARLENDQVTLTAAQDRLNECFNVPDQSAL
jgi:hypothetical protein